MTLAEAEAERLVDTILNHSPARGTVKAVLVALAVSAALGEHPSADDLADMVNVGKRNVRRTLQELVASGELRVVRRAVGRTSTEYEVLTRCDDACRPGAHIDERLAAVRASSPKKVIGAGLRTKVLERDAYRCKGCGTHISLTCDHIIPESQGGPTTLANLQTLCIDCNLGKGVKSQAEWEQMLASGWQPRRGRTAGVGPMAISDPRATSA